MKQAKSVDSTWEQSISGLISGTVLTAAKTIVKYPLDTATVRLQMPNTPYSIYDPISLFRGSFQGITAQLLGTIPSGAVFFAVKDAVKAYISNHIEYPTPTNPPNGLDWEAIWSTCIAVAVAQPPYWLVRNPSEVIKTREQVGDSQHAQPRITNDTYIYDTTGNTTITWDRVQDLYKGYWENIIYAYPADVIKFVLYETLVSLRLQRQTNKNLGSGRISKVGPMEGALYGALSTAVSQCITTPLDVVRNRIMVDGSSTNATKQSSYIDTLVKLAQNEGMGGLFAGVGPKVAKAFLSGAIQFAAYEETSQSIQDMFKK
jgi:solute carrier family 25 S-adenosylmethionine transporter 26